jgi:hypothetical protein
MADDMVAQFRREMIEPRKIAGAGASRTDTGLTVEFFESIGQVAETEDFVEGLLVRGAASVAYGRSNCGKTFLCSDLGMHVALGRDWFGRQVEQGAVIYIAAEGAAGIRKRVIAFRQAHGLQESDLVPFAVIPETVNLRDPAADMQRIVDAIGLVSEHYGMPVVLVIVDTLSRALAGGNENAPDDMGAFVMNTDRIRQATGAHLLTVHHTGKDQAAGARGHSLLQAAIDTEIEVVRQEGTKTSTVSVRKQRELDGGEEWAFRLEVVELGTDRRGNPVTSCIVRTAEPERTNPAAMLKPGTSARVGYEKLLDCIVDEGDLLPDRKGFPRNIRGVSVEAWRNTLKRAGVTDGATDNERAQFGRIKKKLLELNAIAEWDGWIWPTRNTAQQGAT